MKSLILAAATLVTFGIANAADMKEMDMKGMSGMQAAKDAKSGKHTAKGTVKSLDPKAQTVTLNHEPVKSLNWPAMTMMFKVQEKALMDKFQQGKQVEFEFEFEQRGKDYVITGAK
ncbi:MAG: copper-binding protein [Rhodospirillaceae bacterium]